jgi:hypothetical protein
MVSLESIIQELFFRNKSWKRVIIGALLCYILLGFGYLRQLAKSAKDYAELPTFPLNKKRFLRATFSALPLGAFYFLVPMMMAYGTDNLFRQIHLELLSPIPWGLAWIASLSLTAIALMSVPDDPERFFLGLEFEDVLVDWWKLKHIWAWPAIGCWGLVAVLGLPLYGLSFFVGSCILITTLKLDPRTSILAPRPSKDL